MQPQNPPQTVPNSLIRNPEVRRRLAKDNLLLFLSIYLSNYMTHATPAFHREMIAFLQEEKISPLSFAAFRGSAKSTLVSLAYVLWAVMGKPQKKHILLVSRTQEQAKQLLRNLRVEMEREGILRDDLGPFHEEPDEWRNTVLVLSKWNARIMAVSVDQSVRGLRHSEHRPDLIVLDDIEDLESVKTREGRDKTWNWITGECIPAGDIDTRVVIVGNHLHGDSVLERFRKRIQEMKRGVARSYPLLDAEGKCLWPEKFPDQAALDALKSQVPDEIAYRREFLLEIVAPEDQVVKESDLHYYDVTDLPIRVSPGDVFTGVDPAASMKTSADFTAIVSAYVLDPKDPTIYILPDIINKRMEIDDIRKAVKNRSLTLGGGTSTKVFTEEQGQQAWLTQLLAGDRVRVEGISVGGLDKRERLGLLVPAIRAGKILFPPKGTNREVDILIEQITGFGTESHDDVMDAFSLLCNKLLPKLRKSNLGMATWDPATRQVRITTMDQVQQEVELRIQTMDEYMEYQNAFKAHTGLEAFATRY